MTNMHLQRVRRRYEQAETVKPETEPVRISLVESWPRQSYRYFLTPQSRQYIKAGVSGLKKKNSTFVRFIFFHPYITPIEHGAEWSKQQWKGV